MIFKFIILTIGYYQIFVYAYILKELAWLIDEHDAIFEFTYLLHFDIDTRHMGSHLCETDTTDQANIACTYYCIFHVFKLIKGQDYLWYRINQLRKVLGKILPRTIVFIYAASQQDEIEISLIYYESMPRRGLRSPSLWKAQTEVIRKARKRKIRTILARPGPAFLTGTVAFCRVVKAGVSSCTFISPC